MKTTTKLSGRYLLCAAIWCAAFLGAAALAANAATLTVTKTDDTDDGICDNDCSLREAIAAAASSGDTIVFASPTFNALQIITLSDAVNFRELLINKNLTIIGKGANLLTVRRSPTAAAQFRIFTIPSGTVSISGLTITGGNSSSVGGGIYSNANLTLSGVHITGNTALFVGGIEAANSASGNFSTLIITGSTVSNNTATAAGSGGVGGIDTGGGPTTITNTTISSNRGGRVGGINLSSSTLNIVNSTITRNSPSTGGTAGGVYREGTTGAVTIRNSIIAANCAFDAADPACNNVSTPDVSGSTNSGGYNIIGGANSGSGFTNGTNNDQVGTPTARIDPQLYPLRDNGGATPTHALRANSTAINRASSNNAPATDQRGAPRLGNADIGAFEFLPMVTNTNDTGAGSLRQTVADVPAGGFVIFDDDTFRAQAREIALPSGQITVDKSLSIVGTGANQLTIRNTAAASGTSRVFIFQAGGAATANLSDLTVTGGNINGGGGGIIIAAGITSTLTNVVVTGNTAQSNGGGIFNSGALTVIDSTVSNNTAANPSGGLGGGIENSGTLTVINSTISGNTATGSNINGGGILNRATANVYNSTVAFNQASGANSAGGISSGASLTIRNSIIAANCTGSQLCSNATTPDVFNAGGSYVSNGYNLIGNRGAVTAFNQTGDQTGTGANPLDPLLSPLADNGGTTPTHALQPRSPAIDAGNCFGCSLDQRGLTRPLDFPNYSNAAGGDGSDIGAYELQIAPTAAAVSISGRVLTANGRGLLNAGVSIIGADGQTRTATTSAFGYFHFDGLTAGQTIIINVRSKRYIFAPQILALNETATGLILTAQ